MKKVLKFVRGVRFHYWRAEKHWSTVVGVSTPIFTFGITLVPTPIVTPLSDWTRSPTGPVGVTTFTRERVDRD